MANKVLNLAGFKKSYFTVTLPDPDGRQVTIGTPKKKEINFLTGLKDIIDGGDTMKSLEVMYQAVQIILNGNLNGFRFSLEEVEALFDYETIIVFIEAYMTFVSELANRKN